MKGDVPYRTPVPQSESQTSPLGVTCHYEHRKDGYYVVWSADFPEDLPGERKLAPQEINDFVKEAATHVSR